MLSSTETAIKLVVARIWYKLYFICKNHNILHRGNHFLAILLSVLRFRDSDYPFGIFKLFLRTVLRASCRVRAKVLYTTVNNISLVSLRSVWLVEVRENHWPVASHWQTLSHNVASSAPRHEWDSNRQLY